MIEFKTPYPGLKLAFGLSSEKYPCNLGPSFGLPANRRVKPIRNPKIRFNVERKQTMNLSLIGKTCFKMNSE